MGNLDLVMTCSAIASFVCLIASLLVNDQGSSA
jgi:hypothetical protein